MLDILGVVAPVFLLLLAGYLAVRTGAYPASGVDGLLAFVVRVAVPTLLFLSMYQLPLGDVFDLGALVSFYAGAFLCFGLGIAIALAAGRRPGEAVAVGFSAYFSNTVLIGLPIMERAFGPEALTPMLGLIAFHAPLLYTVGLITMEAVRQDGAGAREGLVRAARSIASNALMIGIALGVACNLLGVRLPAPVLVALEEMRAAVGPVALFALGAALTRYSLQADARLAAAVSALLLIVHPAASYALAAYVFELGPELLRAVVVTAALPAGLNIYIFAMMHRRAEGLAASAVLMSTVISVATISIWLAVLGGPGGAQ